MGWDAKAGEKQSVRNKRRVRGETGTGQRTMRWE